MKVLLSVLLVVGCVWAVAAINTETQRAQQFRHFVLKHNRAYRHAPEEYAYRQGIFSKNLDFIEQFNRENTFQVGITEFADLTNEEYVSRLSSFDYSSDVHADNVETVAAPASKDWRTSTNPTVVGPVRNMGSCPSSAAISIVDSISAEYSVKQSSDFYEFNTSYITDCSGSKCNGMTTDTVWTFIKKFGLQWYYQNDPECPTGPGVGICITGPTCITKGDETALMNAVATKGPIPVLIDASQSSFQMYVSGVYSDAKCSSTTVNLAVLLVGYGTTNGQDYWIIRNEWGSSWGMKGDILIARNKNNMCGVATSACYATTAQNCMCVL